MIKMLPDDTKVIVRYIAPPNQSPLANASTDQTVNAGDIVQLDGTKSTDPDGKLVFMESNRWTACNFECN